ncbi:MAG: BhlA/UviB family holin-like peptide [Anaeromicrobium sp.]|uniref:BhlA/UviB family holin-like peptide n=1 Tax=Anaeromicrobium sp. TaxID=1929132 RepID=UPI0025D782EF|nr:BhlA/UviB family holin-like peptide [Anaeromicrobium sp.]MCT4593600.1 BhlA/UviB family holin-like peptide [Anaeromicrobium sp.]
MTIDIIQKLATQYGLFVALVVYVIWDSRLREVKYIRIIDDLSRKFGVITDIKKEVYYIKRSIEKINRG